MDGDLCLSLGSVSAKLSDTILRSPTLRFSVHLYPFQRFRLRITTSEHFASPGFPSMSGSSEEAKTLGECVGRFGPQYYDQHMTGILQTLTVILVVKL